MQSAEPPFLTGSCLCIALLGLLAAGCAGTSPLPPTGDRLAVGTWGGDNVGVIVTDSVTHVHVACTFGDMPGEVRLDPEGRFTVDGSYVLRAYPVMMGPSLPARFSGRVAGRTLTLSIEVNDTVENKAVSQGPITVVYGREPTMAMCPICRAEGRSNPRSGLTLLEGDAGPPRFHASGSGHPAPKKLLR